MEASEVSESATTWRGRFEIELLKRGNTEQARQEMISDTPDWLRAILGIPPKFGIKPLDCTCAKWYATGTHAAQCRHIGSTTSTEAVLCEMER